MERRLGHGQVFRHDWRRNNQDTGGDAGWARHPCLERDTQYEIDVEGLLSSNGVVHALFAQQRENACLAIAGVPSLRAARFHRPRTRMAACRSALLIASGRVTILFTTSRRGLALSPTCQSGKVVSTTSGMWPVRTTAIDFGASPVLFT